MSIACGADGKCPYVYECINRVCVHDGIFPLSVYTSFVYILLPFGLMLTNVGGLSAGSLKVPILMDLLNYPVNQATTLSYAIVTGASMANFILLIPKRHPSKDTSLVDYNIVLLLIPCVCLGSTLGVILVAIIPLLYQDIILFIVLLLFFIYFINKVRLFGKEEKVQQNEKLMIQITDRVQKQDQSSAQPIERQRTTSLKFRGTDLASSSVPEEVVQPPEDIKLLLQLRQYDKGYHVKEILISIAVFAVFEVVSQMAQGKIIKFSFCSEYFAASFSTLIVLFAIYMGFLFVFTRRKMGVYETIGYEYDVQLAKPKVFITICLGGFMGGFLQGIIGVGSGHCMVSALLMVGVHQKVTSATSGYQIVFIGMSSLIEAFANKEITAEEAGWYFGISFLLGGVLTFGLYKFLETRPGANKVLLIIIASICLLSVIGIVPNVYLTQLYYGWDYLLKLKHSFCG